LGGDVVDGFAAAVTADRLGGEGEDVAVVGAHHATS
jgi:hypothetical protein